MEQEKNASSIESLEQEKADEEEEGKKDESSCSSEEEEDDDSESEAETGMLLDYLSLSFCFRNLFNITGWRVNIKFHFCISLSFQSLQRIFMYD